MSPARQGISSRPWPEADGLFRSNPQWLGSDDASSIELSEGRILWLFGDTFISNERTRRGAMFPRNTIGIQTGADPSSASMEFHWRGKGASFFEAENDAWYWPLHGAMIGGDLIVFQMIVRSPRSGLDPIADWRELGALGFFRVDGWAAMRISNPHRNPAEWRIETIATRESDRVIGPAVLVQDDYLLAYAWDAAKRIFLCRWPVDAMLERTLDEPDWWSSRGWTRGGGDPVIFDGATEFSVHRDERSGKYLQTQTMFIERALGVRVAHDPCGPWSNLEVAHIPDESDRKEVFVYAAKAHPELRGTGLVMTYATNADVETCLDDQRIYYPRFARVPMEVA